MRWEEQDGRHDLRGYGTTYKRILASTKFLDTLQLLLLELEGLNVVMSARYLDRCVSYRHTCLAAGVAML